MTCMGVGKEGRGQVGASRLVDYYIEIRLKIVPDNHV